MRRSEQPARVAAVAERVLAAKGAVNAFDVLTGLGWLQAAHTDLWQRRHEAYRDLESHFQSNRERRIEVLRQFAEWAAAQGLEPLPTRWFPKIRNPQQELPITPDDDPELEALYRLGFVKPDLAAAKREATERQAQAPPELVTFLNVRDAACAECGTELAKGEIVFLEGTQPVCLTCADLDHLLFLPSGDAALSRRARQHSRLAVVVLEFHRRRGVQQRRGLLVTQEGLDQAEAECLADEEVRLRRRGRDAARREVADSAYTQQVAAALRELFPGCPAAEATAIAEHACARGSGRVGRSAAAKQLDEDKLRLAVRAHIRHQHTGYDDLLAGGLPRDAARREVADAIDAVLRRWE